MTLRHQTTRHTQDILDILNHDVQYQIQMFDVSVQSSKARQHIDFCKNGNLALCNVDDKLADCVVQNADGSHEIAAFFDMNAYSFTPFHIQQSPFCAGD